MPRWDAVDGEAPIVSSTYVWAVAPENGTMLSTEYSWGSMVGIEERGKDTIALATSRAGMLPGGLWCEMLVWF
jgi:hypothetical protein